MRPIEKYLEDVKKKAGIKTDKELALRIGVKPSAVCHIKTGTNTPSEEHCKKLAHLAGDPVEKVLLLAQVSRASESTRPAWERIMKLFNTAAKAGMLGIAMLFMLGFSSVAQASPSTVTPEIAIDGYYVK